MLYFWISVLQGAGQTSEIIDLGVVSGEFKSFSGVLSWKNTAQKPVSVHIWSDSPLLKSDLLKSRVLAGASIDIPIQVTLPEKAGDQKYELRLLNSSELILHVFQLSLKVLQGEQDVFKAYRNVYWPFRTKEEVFNLRAGLRGDTLHATFDVYNLSGDELNLKGIHANNDLLSVSFEPPNLGHNQFGKMILNLYANPDAAPGFQKQTIRLYRQNKLLTALPVQYTLLPKPQPTRKAPSLTTDIVDHNFKVVKAGEIRQLDIKLSNNGVGSLTIEKMESNCDCLTFNQVHKIAPGKTAFLKVVFNTAGRMGKERKTIAIFSNDPQHPVQILSFQAHIK